MAPGPRPIPFLHGFGNQPMDPYRPSISIPVFAQSGRFCLFALFALLSVGCPKQKEEPPTSPEARSQEAPSSTPSSKPPESPPLEFLPETNTTEPEPIQPTPDPTAAVQFLNGVVTLVGAIPPPAEPLLVEDPFCEQFPVQDTVHLVQTGDGGGLASVLVWISAGIPTDTHYPPPFEAAQLDIQDCQYHPPVLGVMAGQPLLIQNHDASLFQVHARPQQNEEFNLGFVLADTQTERIFPNPEVWIPITCDLHPWMRAFCAVLPHPFFDVTNAHGHFQIPIRGLPPGGYQLSVRHPVLGEHSIAITLPDDLEHTLSFEFQAPAGTSEKEKPDTEYFAH
jgi:hypothetical protein